MRAAWVGLSHSLRQESAVQPIAVSAIPEKVCTDRALRMLTSYSVTSIAMA